MKRAYVLILMVIAGAVLLAPLAGTALAANVDPGSGGGGAAPASTSTDPFIDNCDPSTDKTCKCPKGQVQIGLPIFGSASCVNNSEASGGAVINYLKTVLQLLSMAVGLVILLMLIIAGVQYITSVGDPGQIKAAKNRVVNAITALILFLLMFAILSFLVPGGIF